MTSSPDLRRRQRVNEIAKKPPKVQAGRPVCILTSVGGGSAIPTRDSPTVGMNGTSPSVFNGVQSGARHCETPDVCSDLLSTRPVGRRLGSEQTISWLSSDLPAHHSASDDRSPRKRSGLPCSIICRKDLPERPLNKLNQPLDEPERQRLKSQGEWLRACEQVHREVTDRRSWTTSDQHGCNHRQYCHRTGLAHDRASVARRRGGERRPTLSPTPPLARTVSERSARSSGSVPSFVSRSAPAGAPRHGEPEPDEDPDGQPDGEPGQVVDHVDGRTAPVEGRDNVLDPFNEKGQDKARGEQSGLGPVVENRAPIQRPQMGMNR